MDTQKTTQPGTTNTRTINTLELEQIKEVREEDLAPTNWMLETRDPDAMKTIMYLTHGYFLKYPDKFQSMISIRVGTVEVTTVSGTLEARNFFIKKAVDPVPTDGSKIRVITRKNPPAQGAVALAGGFVDKTIEQILAGTSVGKAVVETDAQAATREFGEEAGVVGIDGDNTVKIIELHNKKTCRSDVRNALMEIFLSQGIKNGDPFSVVTAGVLIYIKDLVTRPAEAGDDASSTFLVNIVDLLERGTGIEDHLEIITDAVIAHPELFEPDVVKAVVNKIKEDVYNKVAKSIDIDYVASKLYEKFESNNCYFGREYIELYKALEKEALNLPAREEMINTLVQEQLSKLNAILDAIGKEGPVFPIMPESTEQLDSATTLKIETMVTTSSPVTAASNNNDKEKGPMLPTTEAKSESQVLVNEDLAGTIACMLHNIYSANKEKRFHNIIIRTESNQKIRLGSIYPVLNSLQQSDIEAEISQKVDTKFLIKVVISDNEIVYIYRFERDYRVIKKGDLFAIMASSSVRNDDPNATIQIEQSIHEKIAKLLYLPFKINDYFTVCPEHVQLYKGLKEAFIKNEGEKTINDLWMQALPKFGVVGLIGITEYDPSLIALPEGNTSPKDEHLKISNNGEDTTTHDASATNTNFFHSMAEMSQVMNVMLDAVKISYIPTITNAKALLSSATMAYNLLFKPTDISLMYAAPVFALIDFGDNMARGNYKEAVYDLTIKGALLYASSTSFYPVIAVTAFFTSTYNAIQLFTAMGTESWTKESQDAWNHLYAKYDEWMDSANICVCKLLGTEEHVVQEL